MPTIRELVSAIAGRDGVEAAVLLGRDGLLIDGHTHGRLEAERLAALVPPVLSAAQELSRDASRGAFVSSVLEFDLGLALITAISDDAVLLVLMHPTANVGSLLFDIRRQRANIAAIV